MSIYRIVKIRKKWNLYWALAKQNIDVYDVFFLLLFLSLVFEIAGVTMIFSFFFLTL